MPTVTLNKKAIEKIIGKKLNDEQLKDRISMLGTDLEKINNKEITVEIFPNRPDLLSEQGLGRALASFIGTKKGLKKYTTKKGTKDYKIIIEPSVKKVRPYTTSAIVKKLKLNNERIREIIQIQEKLHVSFGRNRKRCAIGIYPLENIKLPITYKAMPPEKIKFIPLESTKKMNALEILEEHPAGKAYGYLLKWEKEFPVFIDANNEVLSIPPIINSHNTGKITEKTTEVFIECSGHDFEVMKECINIIVTALSDMGAEIYHMTLEEGKKKTITPDLNPKSMKVDAKFINKLLGLELNDKQIKNCLEKMGYSYSNKKVQIPCYRTDIIHQADLAEDVAIAYGYENFEPEIPNVATIGKEDEFEIFKNKVTTIMTSLGLIETVSYHLTNKNIHNKKMLCELKLVELENALNNDYSVLRSWIMPSLMQVLGKNTNRDYPQKIFEIGNVFKHNDKTETGVEENVRLAVIVCGKETNYTEVKQLFDSLMKSIGLNYNVKNDNHPSFINGRVGRASIKNKNIAYIGEINPEVLDNFGVEMPASGFEINLTELYEVLK